MKITQCRYCGQSIKHILDLGRIPLVNYFPNPSEASKEKRYPLCLMVCSSCGLVQLDEVVPVTEIFSTYHYVTGASAPLVSELSRLAGSAIRSNKLTSRHRVLDIGCNDGTLLSFFREKGIQTVGIEPSKELIRIASKRGLETVHDFFSLKTSGSLLKKYGTFDLICATHVLANIIDLGDFFDGVLNLLAHNGVFIAEVADADVMLEKCQFDSVYHEHYSYFTLQALRRIAGDHGLTITRIAHSNVQGGALRVTMKRANSTAVKSRSKNSGGHILTKFASHAAKYKASFRALLSDYKGQKIAGFGAPAKSVTLASFVGITKKNIAYIVDSTPVKHGKLHPGTAIPVVAESRLLEDPPDVVLIFSWNYRNAVIKKLRKLVSPKTIVIIPFPELVADTLGSIKI